MSTRNPFGWDLPPGVTNRDIDRAAGAGPECCEECGETFPANELEDGLCESCQEEKKKLQNED